MSKGKNFSSKPNFQEICAACATLFGLEERWWFTHILHAVKNNLRFDLTEENFAFGDDFHVEIVPRYQQATFHISTLAIEYSRRAVKVKCKDMGISGQITRNYVNSLQVTLCHPDVEVLGDAIEELRKMAKDNGGTIDNENDIVRSFGHGTLTPCVLAQRGTAKRNDGVPSWEDEDARSGSTYFNVPAPAPVASSSISRGGLADRLNSRK